jgi:hypothetical protein
MENTTQTDLSFLSWAKRVYAQKRDVLELMLKSDSALDKIIAADIIKTVEGVDNV